MYSPRHNIDSVTVSEWPARQDLIRQTIAEADCDIVCLQETCGDSFATDFSFMAELGYTSELYKKGRFRPATFWRPSRVELADKPMHRDRCLVTQFKLNLADESAEMQEKRVWVANVHLQVCHH